jgi:hypothetical protein
MIEGRLTKDYKTIVVKPKLFFFGEDIIPQIM